MSPSLDELHSAFLKLTGSPPPQPAVSDAEASTGEGQPVEPPPPPCQLVDPKARGYHLDVSVAPDQVVDAAKILDERGFGMDTVTGVDWMAENQMEVVYDFFHPESVLHIVVRTRIPRDKPELPTIQGVFPGANWHERETHDFFGIRFLGHPDLSPLLLPEDADYHPLRKDFSGAA